MRFPAGIGLDLTGDLHTGERVITLPSITNGNGLGPTQLLWSASHGAHALVATSLPQTPSNGSGILFNALQRLNHEARASPQLQLIEHPLASLLEQQIVGSSDKQRPDDGTPLNTENLVLHAPQNPVIIQQRLSDGLLQALSQAALVVQTTQQANAPQRPYSSMPLSLEHVYAALLDPSSLGEVCGAGPGHQQPHTPAASTETTRTSNSRPETVQGSQDARACGKRYCSPKCR